MQVKLDKFKIWQDLTYFIGFGFGAGLMPFAPGTWGTLAAFPLYLLLAPLPLIYYLLIVLALFIAGVFISDKITKALGVDDYSGIVFDEIIGYLLTMAAVPFSLKGMLIGFLLFRLFDIWKPFPICWIDSHIHGGLGIMLDDVLAAIPAWLIMQGLILGSVL